MILDERVLLQIDSDYPFRTCVKNGRTYSTDGRMIIEVDKVISKHEKHKTFPVEKVINEPCNINKFFGINKIADFLESKENRIICKVCNGSGESEWECEGYTKYDDCPVCDGSGKVESKEIVKINDVYFSVIYLKTIINVAKITENSTVNVVRLDSKTINIFTIGNYKIYLMPLRGNSYNEEVLEIELEDK